MLQIRCIPSDYNLKWYYYFSASNDLVGILLTISIRLRGHAKHFAGERNVRSSSGRIVQRDFHTALITRPDTRRTKCSERHGMPLHVKRSQAFVVRTGYVRQRRVTRARPSRGERCQR